VPRGSKKKKNIYNRQFSILSFSFVDDPQSWRTACVAHRARRIIVASCLLRKLLTCLFRRTLFTYANTRARAWTVFALASVSLCDGTTIIIYTVYYPSPKIVKLWRTTCAAGAKRLLAVLPCGHHNQTTTPMKHFDV
jgi:hypothetical protein